MIFEITRVVRGVRGVIYRANIPIRLEDKSYGCRLGYAVLQAMGDKADLRGADLRNADLRNADLRDADLRDADLRNADLRHANLREADMRNADLRHADLRHANLRGADMRCATVCGARVRGADMRGTDLRRAYLFFGARDIDCPGYPGFDVELLARYGAAGDKRTRF